MIIIGYQGIGKSSLAKKDQRVIDLESSNFFVEGKRFGDWFKVYANIAEHLSEQGYIVFTSSHQVVRHELSKKKQPIAICCPSLKLKDEWIEKLQKRYNETQSPKDYKALKNAELEYSDSIGAIMEDAEKYKYARIIINSMDYDLADCLYHLSKRPLDLIINEYVTIIPPKED